MRRRDAVSAGLFLILSLLVCLAARQLPLGGLHNPGPGFFPLLLGSVLGILSLLLLTRAIFKERTYAAVDSSTKHPGGIKVAYTASGLLVYALVLDKIGFLIATTLLLMFFFRFIAPQKWHVILGASVFITLCLHLMFNTWLGMQLPVWGIFGL